MNNKSLSERDTYTKVLAPGFASTDWDIQWLARSGAGS